MVGRRKPTTIIIINNASFTETVNSPDIDLSEYKNVLITYKTGTKTDTATMDVKLQVKNSKGVYIDHTSLTQITTASTGLKEIKDVLAKTGRVVCTFGGAGNYATTTVEVELKP